MAEEIEKKTDSEAAEAHAADMKALGIESAVSKNTEAKEPEKEADKPAEPVKDEPKEPEKEADKEPEGAKAEGEEPKPERPLKYVPVPVYQEEKKRRKDLEAELKTKTDELAALKNKPETASTEKDKETIEAEIRTIAEGMGADEGAVQKLIGLASRGNLTSEERAKFNEVIKQAEEFKAQNEQKAKAEAEAAHFEKEWTTVARSKLDELAPGATDKQLAEAKEKLDEIAHSDEFYRYPIDYVIFKNAEIFKTILTNPKKKSAEGGQLGKGAPPVNGRTKIDMANMNPAKLAQIEQELAAGGEEPLVITREGEQLSG